MARSTTPTITTFRWVPEFARGHVRDVRARWAFEEVGMDYDVKLIDDAKTPAHRHFQPFGQVPTYSDGDVEIFESGAIALHIAALAPGLLPTDPAAHARAVQWVIAALNSVEPIAMDLVMVDIFQADAEWSKARRPGVVAALRGRLADLSAALGDKDHLDGDAFTVGDLMMVSVIRGISRDEILDDFPNLTRYIDRCKARPAFRKSMADHLAVYAEPAAA